jgi:hypothetical protein
VDNGGAGGRVVTGPRFCERSFREVLAEVGELLEELGVFLGEVLELIVEGNAGGRGDGLRELGEEFLWEREAVAWIVSLGLGRGAFAGIGEDGELCVLLFGEQTGTEGAIGLEAAQLGDGVIEGPVGAGAVAVELAHGGGAFVEEERVGVAGVFVHLEFEEAEAAEAPGGVGELFEDDLFEGAYGGEGAQELDTEAAVFFALVGEDGGAAGGEAVFGGVFRHDGLAFEGARTGGALGVGGVGELLCGGGHGLLLVAGVGAFDGPVEEVGVVDI